MKKKISVLFAVCILVLLMGVQVLAADQPLVNDQAGLLTAEEVQTLNARAEEITAKEAATVCILTVNSLNGKNVQAFADDYFDENHMGTGADSSGILFMVAMDERTWAISTTGFCITAFTDYGQFELVNRMKDNLSYSEFAEAFRIYLDSCEELLDLAHQGTPLDVPEGQERQSMASRMANPFKIVISLILGFLCAMIPMKKMKKQVKNVEFQASAQNYAKEDTFTLTRSDDAFLYRNINRIPIVQDNNKSGGGFSGGSSIHMGSSGTTHGGSSGRF